MFLHTLYLETTGIVKLPCSIGMLRQLVCLRAHKISAPDGVIGRLTSLEVLQMSIYHDNDESLRQFVKDLGHLRELRVIEIYFDSHVIHMDEGTRTDLAQSIGNLQKMQNLSFCQKSDVYMKNDSNAAVPSRDLRCLFVPRMCFTKLPSWINSMHLPSLTHLEIFVDDLDEQDLIALGRLPELCYLRVVCYSQHGATITSANTVADGYFRKLRSLKLEYSLVQFVANEDSSALFTICSAYGGKTFGRTGKKDNRRVVPANFTPNLEELRFHVNVEQLTQKGIGCEDIGLEYLPSIRKVNAVFDRDNAFEDDVEREEDALRHAIEVHPNHPTLQIEYVGGERIKIRSYGDDDDDEEEETLVVAD